MSVDYEKYYVPEQSIWPFVGSVALFLFFIGLVNILHGNSWAIYLFWAGAALLVYMLVGWFRHVIQESHAGLYSAQMSRSFRWGMGWFIFSEVMFFAAFFGALFYARVLSGPWLEGAGTNIMTGQLLWNDFTYHWPLLENPDPEAFPSPSGVIGAWGLPAINTLILLTSGLTLTIAHWGLMKENRKQLILGLAATVALGILFLVLQAYEYVEAYHDLGLTLGSGIYGSTFFMLTGFHGLHVTVGAIMLIAILGRCMKGHFTKEEHFGFEATAWYWHFVDVVWLLLFVLVYWL